MNPLTNVKNITKLNEREIALGTKGTWHDQYKDSAWIFIGGLPYDLTEGDIICVFSQFGEIVNVNLIRDKKSGKSKGFCFLCYENQKSTVLAVDNLNGIKILGRIIRVDHVSNYKPPKEREDDDEITKALYQEGCAPKVPQEIESEIEEKPAKKSKKKKDKEKKKKKKDRKKNKKQKESSSSSDSDDDNTTSSEDEKAQKVDVKVKLEKHDPAYDKYDAQSNDNGQRNRIIGPVRASTSIRNGNVLENRPNSTERSSLDRRNTDPRDELRDRRYNENRRQNSRDRSFDRRQDGSRERRNERYSDRKDPRDERSRKDSKERSLEKKNFTSRDRLQQNSNYRLPQSYGDRNRYSRDRSRSRERGREFNNGRENFKDRMNDRKR